MRCHARFLIGRKIRPRSNKSLRALRVRRGRAKSSKVQIRPSGTFAKCTTCGSRSRGSVRRDPVQGPRSHERGYSRTHERKMASPGSAGILPANQFNASEARAIYDLKFGASRKIDRLPDLPLSKPRPHFAHTLTPAATFPQMTHQHYYSSRRLQNFQDLRGATAQTRCAIKTESSSTPRPCCH